MADSRRASSALYTKRMERLVATQSHIIALLLCILGALVLTHLVKGPEFTTPQVYVLFLLFFSVGLWVTEAVPPFATGLMIIGFLVFSLGNQEVQGNYDIDVGAYVDTWSDSVIWLLLGGFFLAQAFTNTGLDIKLFSLATKRFGTAPSRLLMGLMITTAVASMFISNTATTAMVFAAATPLFARSKELPNFTKAVILGIPAAAGLGGMASLIGSPPNAVAADMINNMPGNTIRIGFLEWMYYGLPLGIVLVLVMWKALQWKYPLGKDKVEFELSLPQDEPTDDSQEYVNMRLRRRIVLVVLAITVIGWLTERVHHFPAAAISGIPIIAYTMVGIITGDDVRKLPWDTLMLVAGGLSLGLALQHTGISEYFVEKLGDFHMAPVLIIAAFALVTVLLSNVMSNTAAVSILVPASVLISVVKPEALAMIIGLSASCALFLPVSTPPNAIAYSTGLVEQKEFRYSGVIAGLLGPVLIVLWVLLLM